MENIMISDDALDNLFEKYNCSHGDQKILLLNKIASLDSSQTTFNQWIYAARVYCEVEDFALQKILTQKMSEMARNIVDLSNACQLAFDFGLDDFGLALLPRISAADDVSVEILCDTYEECPKEEIGEILFCKIKSRNPNFAQWLLFCQSDIFNEKHFEYALQKLSEVESTVQQLLGICKDEGYKNGLFDARIGLLATRLITERGYTINQLAEAYDESMIYPQPLEKLKRILTLN